ncbi:hypothetical protein [uncultured Campylobacter sp.]|uniref:hypothetical protein n=1 Tax=uncultured Campylobacter sp. TaxID=218934 RepID=UPI00262DB807|nr:hypothetical protein [uncultured Campylobacter sp.]
MKDKDTLYKRKILIVFVLLIGSIFSGIGLLTSFILAKLSLFNSFDFFISLPLIMQIPFLMLYFLLWIMLIYVVRKELS